MNKPIFIAEIKTKSPFGYVSKNSFVELMECAIKYGDWISVHTNALWGGDMDAISFVRKFTDKPILAKGIHGSDEAVQSALYHKADYVLSVDRIPRSEYLASQCIFEYSDLDLPRGIKDSYKAFLDVGDTDGFNLIDSIQREKWNKFLKENMFVCNSRNLRDGSVYSKSKIEEYFEKCGTVIQASNIKTMKDVNPRSNAFIVGEHLMEFCKTL
jgi:indole-3-glycerol phosphate synthase